MREIVNYFLLFSQNGILFCKPRTANKLFGKTCIGGGVNEAYPIQLHVRSINLFSQSETDFVPLYMYTRIYIMILQLDLRTLTEQSLFRYFDF